MVRLRLVAMLAFQSHYGAIATGRKCIFPMSPFQSHYGAIATWISRERFGTPKFQSHYGAIATNAWLSKTGSSF
jgi:hypothetical protein